jgi:uncharacterized BrkB/YihY/UPF0761 family membrane protein
MPPPTYRALRTILSIFSLLAAAAGLTMIFASKAMIIHMHMFLRPPESEFSTLLLSILKEMGGMILMFSLLFFFASRDPLRNVAIVDALIVGLCVLVLTSLLSLYTLDLSGLYPGYLIWGRSAVRLALAALLYYLRPREATASQS